MSTGAALGIGIGLGLVLMVGVSLWVVIHGRLSKSAGYVAMASIVAVPSAATIFAGSIRSAIVLVLGFGIGIAVSSVVTLPLGALAGKRHGRDTMQ